MGAKGAELLFTDNETHEFGHEIPSHYYKDGFHRYLLLNEKTINPSKLEPRDVCIIFSMPSLPRVLLFCIFA